MLDLKKKFWIFGKIVQNFDEGKEKKQRLLI